MVFRKSPTITKRTRRKVWRGMPWRALMTTRDGPGSWLSAGGGPVQGRHIVVLIRGRDHLDDGLHGDRKSTRLNSSHVAISYAVFCLKKKNGEDHRCTVTQTNRGMRQLDAAYLAGALT